MVRYPVAQLILARKVSFVTHVDNFLSTICENIWMSERMTKVEDRRSERARTDKKTISCLRDISKELRQTMATDDWCRGGVSWRWVGVWCGVGVVWGGDGGGGGVSIQIRCLAYRHRNAQILIHDCIFMMAIPSINMKRLSIYWNGVQIPSRQKKSKVLNRQN